MKTPTTEQLHHDAIGLDTRPLKDAAALLANAQATAAQSPLTSLDTICSGAIAMANTLRQGGKIRYVAAGSSGLMAAADALELGGTFSIPATQIRIHMAGGIPTGVEMPGNVEDDVARIDNELSDLSADDTVIAVSASGTTPYTIAAAKFAQKQGAVVVGIANNAGSPLLDLADHPVLLTTPPELVSGSTRMGAGTAQKIALNMLSTLMAMELGHIQDGMMINLRADNDKLRARAAGIVAHLTGTDHERARQTLTQAHGDLKCAALIAAGATDLEMAKAQLQATDGHLRPALERMKKDHETINLGESK